MPVEPNILVAFLATAAFIVLSPGPDTVLILRHALGSGQRFPMGAAGAGGAQAPGSPRGAHGGVPGHRGGVAALRCAHGLGASGRIAMRATPQIATSRTKSSTWPATVSQRGSSIMAWAMPGMIVASVP